MSSGVAVSDATKTLYEAVKMNKSGKKKYAVFKVSGDLKQIEPDPERQAPEGQPEERPSGQPEDFRQLLANLPKDDGRYIVYDYPYQGSFGPTSKLILILWCPESVSIKRKMLYASSKDALKKCVSEIGGEFQADSPDDLSHKDIEGKLSRV